MMSETWEYTSRPILTTLEELNCQEKMYEQSGGLFPHTADTWESRRPHKIEGFLVRLLGRGKGK